MTRILKIIAWLAAIVVGLVALILLVAILVYPYESNVTTWENNTEDDCDYNFYRDSLIPGGTEIMTFGVGTYDYIYNVTNCTNYTDASLTRTLTL